MRSAILTMSNRRSRFRWSWTNSHGAISLVLAVVIAATAQAAPPSPPIEVTAIDRPDDRGNGVLLRWTLSADDRSDGSTGTVLRYDIFRDQQQEPLSTEPIGMAPYSVAAYEDGSCEPGRSYVYRIVAIDGTGQSSAPGVSNPVVPQIDWFNRSKIWYAALLLVVTGAVGVSIARARLGGRLWLRQIPALQAVDEAVGRATEMGRPCLYINGLVDIDEMPTIAGLTVLSRVARTVAEYDAELIVPTSRSLVMTAARETVQGAYLAAGRPEQFRPDMVYYLTDEQFGFASAVAGTMTRERPAACFYFGQFYAESLLLAETGQSIGAIQIAGTNETSQLPFFVAACDYTLIGEEFFAASAYLSGEPQQLGSIKGQDIGKLLAGALMIVGVLLATLTQLENPNQASSLRSALTYLTQSILG